MRDVDEEIREIKKEIIESRGLVIKTNNLTNSLAADIKAIAKRQAGYERRFNWNSGVAYFLFAALTFGGLKLALDARISEVESEKDDVAAELAVLREDLAEQSRRVEQRDQAEARATQFYELIRQQKRAEVVDGYDGIRKAHLSPAEHAFFRDTVDRFRLDLSVVAYQNGLEMIRTGRYAEAAEKFQETMRLKDDAAHIPAVKYHLARSLRKLGRLSEAKVLAQAVIEQSIDKDLQPDATWLLSQCAEELGDLDQAREAMRSILRRWPRSSLIPDARRRIRDLNVKALHGSSDAP